MFVVSRKSENKVVEVIVHLVRTCSLVECHRSYSLTCTTRTILHRIGLICLDEDESITNLFRTLRWTSTRIDETTSKKGEDA